MANEIVYTGEADNDGLGNSLRQAFMLLNERHQFVLSMLSGRGAWSTGRAYKASPQREWVVQGGLAYICTTDHTSGTFATDLAAGRWLAVDVAQLLADLASTTATQGAARIALDYLTTGSAASHVRNWFMNADVTAEMFSGVDPAGATDSTTGLSRALAYAIATNRALVLQGSYLISGPLLGYVTTANNKNLHLRIAGETSITVDPAAAGFDDVLYFKTATVNDVSVSGAALTINGNNRVGRGLSFVHSAASTGGTVSITAPVTVLNIKDLNASGSREVTGIAVVGRYQRVIMQAPVVRNLDRTRTAGQACKGIGISEVDGKVTLISPEVDTILSAGAANVDADGIAVFGLQVGTSTEARAGSCEIITPRFRNCQGRSFKGQISDARIIGPVVERTSDVVTQAQSSDFDFQACGEAVLIEPTFYYTDTGAGSPLSSSHSPVVFQHTLTNRRACGRTVGGVIYTNVTFRYYCIPLYGVAAALDSVTEVDGINVINASSLTSAVFTRAAVEVDLAQVAAKTGKSRVLVRGVEAQMQGRSVLGYTGAGTSVAAKFSYEVTDCYNTHATRGFAQGAVSGSRVAEVESFKIRDNRNLNDLIFSGTINFANLQPGCKFTADLATTTAINNPPWPSTGYAYVEVLSQWDTSAQPIIRVIVDDGTQPGLRWWTRTGGSSWASDALPTYTAAQIAAKAGMPNTKGKALGVQVWDTTNNRIMVARGSFDTDQWTVADGSASVTPA